MGFNYMDEDHFTFKAADFYPFKDTKEIERCRAITKEDILAMGGKHPNGNPNIRLDVLKNEEFEMVMLTDMVKRIVDSDRYDKKVVLIMPNPCPTYRKVAYMLREMNVNCRNVKFYMISQIMDLGFKEENFIYHSNKTTPDFSKMLEQDGEADNVYSGPGWPGHLAFIDPVEDWFQPTMEEYCAQGAKVAHLHPLTIAQNSLHGSFGCSGDISKVPPMGAMMGPRDAMKAKNVLDCHGITTAGTKVTWQRLTSRLCIFGKPSQEVPASILQLRDKPTHIIMSENLAATVEPEYYFQY